MVFDPKKYLIKVQGNKQYLPVSARLIWFREQHPDWGIETRPVVIDTDKEFAIFEATVFNSDGKLMSKGTKMEDIRGFPDYVEKAETGAIGRALAVCGFGTQFAPELDELASGRFVDSPQASRPPESGRYDQNRYPSRDSSPAPRDNGYRPQQSPASYNGNGGGQTRPTPDIGNAQSQQPSTSFNYGAQPRPVADANVNQAQQAPPSYNGNGASRLSPEAANAQHKDAAQNSAATSEFKREPAQEQATTVPSHTPDRTESTSPSPAHSCSACGRELTQSQEALSLRKYGVALCPTCQKERRAAEVG